MTVHEDSGAAAAIRSAWAERRVTVRAGDAARHFTLSTRTQLVGAAACLALVIWAGAATVAATLGAAERDALMARIDRLEVANTEALTAVEAERDALADEARTARERLTSLSQALTDRQTRLMDAADVEAELSLALETVRANLREATADRDAAMLRQQALSQELEETQARAAAAEAAETEWTEASASIVGALPQAAPLRDAAETRRTSLETELTALQNRVDAASQARARLYDQLEDAIAAGLGGLERTLDATGFDLDELVERLRRDYSCLLYTSPSPRD